MSHLDAQDRREASVFTRLETTGVHLLLSCLGSDSQ